LLRPAIQDSIARYNWKLATPRTKRAEPRLSSGSNKKHAHFYSRTNVLLVYCRPNHRTKDESARSVPPMETYDGRPRNNPRTHAQRLSMARRATGARDDDENLLVGPACSLLSKKKKENGARVTQFQDATPLVYTQQGMQLGRRANELVVGRGASGTDIPRGRTRSGPA
jgi:hypothetical protein